MFNVHLFDRKLNARRKVEKDEVQQLILRQKTLSLRNILTANYARRVDQFMMNMANDPIQLSEHIGPLAVVPRTTDPAKYKGLARMTIKANHSRAYHSFSCEETLPVASSGVTKPYEFRSRDITKELNYKVGLKSKIGSKAVTPAKKSVASHNSTIAKISDPLNVSNISELSNPGDTAPKLKLTVADLNRKTHFKGVMSRLVEKAKPQLSKDVEEVEDSGHTFHRSRTASILWRNSKLLNQVYLREDESAVLAKEVLESCNVIPRLANNGFLKRGEGRLTSNPFLSTGEVYKRLSTSFQV